MAKVYSKGPYRIAVGDRVRSRLPRIIGFLGVQEEITHPINK